MTNGFIKKTGQKAQDVAKRIAQEAREEKQEYAKSAKNQLGVPTEAKETSPEISLVDEIITGKDVTTSVTPQEHEDIHARERKRMQQLAEDLKKAHEQEVTAKAAWQKSQEEALKPPQDNQEKPLVIPTPRPKMGVLSGMAQKAKGGLELMKGKK